MYVKGSCSLTTHVLSKILRLLYMYTMVGHLFQNDDTIYVRFSVSHVYLQSFLLHDIRAFFVTYTCVLFPSIWPFSYKRAYICAQKKPIYMRYKQACGTCGRRKLSYKRHRIIPSAKNTFMYDGAEKGHFMQVERERVS